MAAGAATSGALNSIDSSIRGFLAIFIVVGGLVTAALFWDLQGGSSAAPYLSAMTGLIGGVSGYYFGSHQTDQANQKAKTATDAVDDLQRTVRSLTTRLAKVNSAIRDLAEASVPKPPVTSGSPVVPAPTDTVKGAKP